ncbi:MAG: hypothetical protein JXB48_21245 [Candidatus Latescibacteria bacterium]|nr:hypothetical protein [Candidatus Latescibacterota bacterium]
MAITQDQFESICQKIETSSDGLRKILKINKIATETFYRFQRSSQKNIERYTRAKKNQIENISDEIRDIESECKAEIDNCEDSKKCNAIVNYYRLKIDTLKWLLSKLVPEKYGEKLDLTSGGDKLPIPPSQLVVKIAKDEDKK